MRLLDSTFHPPKDFNNRAVGRLANDVGAIGRQSSIAKQRDVLSGNSDELGFLSGLRLVGNNGKARLRVGGPSVPLGVGASRSSLG